MRKAKEPSLRGPYMFYGKKVTLWFDVNNHVYLREYDDGKMVQQDGVTSIVHIIDKSDALVPWAAKKVAEKMIDIMPVEPDDDFNMFTTRLSPEAFYDLVMSAKKAPRDIKEDAADLGTLAHNCLEDSIRAAMGNILIFHDDQGATVTEIINWPVEPRSINCVKAAFDWMQKHHVRWLETERKVYSKKHCYAGTMDGLAYVSSCTSPKCCPAPFTNRLSLIDWKSSNGLWLEYRLQVAAYLAAYQEETSDEVTDRFILRLGKEDGKFEPWHLELSDQIVDFKGFLQCLELSRTHKEIKAIMSQTKKDRKKFK